MINLSIHSQISEYPTEKRYDANTKIGELKKKLELVTGAEHSTMKLTVWFDDDKSRELDNDDQTLGHYLEDYKGTTVKLTVKDESGNNPLAGDVPKYTIPEEKYVSRSSNARQFIKEMREKQGTTQ